MRGEATQRAYSSLALRGGGCHGAGTSVRNRSSSTTATGSPSFPSRRASRPASDNRPSIAAPQATSAAAVPATIAMLTSAQRRGAGRITPASAGSQRNVYHSGQAPFGLHSQRPPIAASAPHAHAAGSTHEIRPGPLQPRTSAAATTTSTLAGTG